MFGALGELIVGDDAEAVNICAGTVHVEVAVNVSVVVRGVLVVVMLEVAVNLSVVVRAVLVVKMLEVAVNV